MPLGALRPSPLVEQAAQALREEIAAGRWPVGTKLPGETTLAAQLGVGRSTVREALRALAGAGLVQPRQGSGVFVMATEAQEDWPARLRRAAIGDVYEVRMLVEVQAARLAATRRTEADITALRVALATRREIAAGVSKGAELDARFVDADIALHAAVVAAAHNPVLTDLFAEFVPALRKGLIDLLGLLDVRSHERGHGDAAHAALVEAVAGGDAGAAGDILEQELRETLAHLR
ncbi:FadR/GntR family transcriptional regulator [Nonomuraea endophytica]|uniref:DNA-binding FadR family transcriptional regulator n=1 Tax=Nonomuraea endophytica TaxID=714136 RepID=A0A7W8A6I0_9ACTN|nr:GntR family transcriptional regulator [Nonomuraea endophytica]MBB5079566.1 DNA-binding FadR family transcriptional regulator [Nonomuraea endophytica]